MGTTVNINHTAATVSKNRELSTVSSPLLVSWRRDHFRRLAKAKLLNTPDAPAIEAVLKRIDEELGRRKIAIQDPELL